MIIIWYKSSTNEYGYSSQNEFMKLLDTPNLATGLVKVEQLEGVPDYIVKKLVNDMNKHNTQFSF